ncbi:MAG TPA: DUF3788 domain-containing protein [Longilinea sp.]|nr:DUF3788 domain-containing protein [Longilinea sp.]
MSISAFSDKEHQPTDSEIREAIGSLYSTWQELAQWIREKYTVQEDFKFLYGTNYGWGLRFRIKGKLLINLYPGRSSFTAQIILHPEAVEAAQSMKLGENARQAIERANPYPEGRWLFIPVKSRANLEDVQRLLALRVAK